MGFGTFVPTKLHFSHVTYNDRRDVEDKMDDNNTIIENFKRSMALLIGPVAIKQLNEICNRLDDMFEAYDDAVIDNYKLEKLLENWDERDGDFVVKPGKPDIRTELGLTTNKMTADVTCNGEEDQK
jgi:hypothetical protein